jgi:serine/threonine protein kinase
MPVDDTLRDVACQTLGVTNPTPLLPGGQKSVFSVHRNGEELAMKIISNSSAPPDALERAEREVELLSKIDSPHIVKVRSELVELGVPLSGVAWLEELLDGDDLTAHLGSEWPWNEARDLGIQLANGLGALHDLHVIHRDLSPNNVRRRANGTYTIMDPGYARHELRSGITIGGHPGTPGYASPEHLHAHSGSPTPYSDVFAVGILMFEALTGEVPIPYLNDQADYIRRLQDVQRQDLRDLRPDLADPQVSVIDRCLHPQPARRFKNGHILAEQLRGTQ